MEISTAVQSTLAVEYPSTSKHSHLLISKCYLGQRGDHADGGKNYDPQDDGDKPQDVPQTGPPAIQESKMKP